METRIIDSSSGRDRLIAGAELAAEVVGSTMGPSGRFVAIEYRGDVPEMTKDGVSVARRIFLEDPVMEMGNELVKMACLRTNAKTGDGTSGTSVLAGSLARTLSEAMDGRPSSPVIAGAKAAVRDVVGAVRASSVPFCEEDGRKVGRISANDATLGDLAFDSFGGSFDVDVQVELTGKPETEVSASSGLRIPSGYHSEHFVNSEAVGACILENVHVLACDSVIEDANDIFPAISAVAAVKGASLLVVAEGFSEAVSGTMVDFAGRGIPICAVRMMATGTRSHEIAGDLAALGGGVPYGQKSGRSPRDFSMETAPKFGRVYANRQFCDVMDDSFAPSEEVTKRLESAEKSLSETESDVEKAHFRRRIRGLRFRFAYIRVGGSSDAERHENAQRIEDAVGAVKAAAESGTVLGCGQALHDASYAVLPPADADAPFEAGYLAVLKSCRRPKEVVLGNAGAEEVGRGQVNPVDLTECDYRGIGVLDPTDIPCFALEHAVSVAILIANTRFSVEFKDRVGPYAQ